MSIIQKKEKNLIQLVNKLNSLSLTYSQPNYEIEKIKSEKNEILSQKNEIEKKNQELIREHKYLKDRIKNLQLEVHRKLKIEDDFNQEIEELSQETENLVSEIEKWQM
jgi:peptidoglycan hydrolase CwlO-like protein|tara:strand:+ start:67 stop:390 length:324 start_codon:yes stop_codon:yes gene_type:complete